MSDGCTHPKGHSWHFDEEIETFPTEVHFFPIKWCIRCGDKQASGSSYSRPLDKDGQV